jgi:hypothetical protein
MKPEREVGFCFSIHVIEKIVSVVNSERAGLFETPKFGAFEKRVWFRERAGEKRKKDYHSNVDGSPTKLKCTGFPPPRE